MKEKGFRRPRRRRGPAKGSAFREGRPVQTERIAAWVEREAVQRPPKAFARGLEEGFAADPTTQEGAIPIVGRGDPADLGSREPAAGDEHGLGQGAHGFDVHAYRGVLRTASRASESECARLKYSEPCASRGLPSGP